MALYDIGTIIAELSPTASPLGFRVHNKKLREENNAVR